MGLGKIKKAQILVKRYLEAYPKLRDSDNKLICRIWNDYLYEREIDSKQITAHALFVLVATDELPSFESISRARRKVQELHPELRGLNYKTRKDEEEKVRIGITR